MKKLTLDDWITSSGRYSERAKSYELTASVIKNAKSLLEKVNLALEYVGQENPKVSSGFRTRSVNQSLPNSAKMSAHMSGEAIDILDPSGDLDRLLTRAVLEKFDLYREDSEYTQGWCHLQTRKTSSGKRIFIP